jgi:hypothetical protein
VVLGPARGEQDPGHGGLDLARCRGLELGLAGGKRALGSTSQDVRIYPPQETPW